MTKQPKPVLPASKDLDCQIIDDGEMASTKSMTAAPEQAFVTMEGITKRFGSEVLANDDVSFDVRKGEVHALLGENGAGKSTLMNILYGLYEPTEGRTKLHGTSVVFKDPSDAINAGIGMIHQEFMLVEQFTVVENLVMGTTELPADADNPRTAAQEITRISKEYGLQVSPHARIEDLAVGERQRVEILKLLFRHAQLLILDEPTAVLTPQETDSFFGVLGKLRSRGKSIVIVTHKLHEVMAISDRVSVMRDGRLITTVQTADTSEAELVKAMVGRAEIPTSEIPVRFPADCGRRRRIRAESGRAGASGGVPVEIRDVSRVCPWGGSVGRSGAPGRPAPRRRPSGRSGDVQGHRRVPVGQGGVECPPVGDREVVEV